MPFHDYMAASNARYYATRDPLGLAGDFTTAPEISQMFGELVGVWLADLWLRADSPPAAYVELGPGRGTLAVDARRAARKAGFAPPVHLVETSPTLRTAQAERFFDATWHDTVDTLPDDRPLFVVANEFFDALPVRQYERTPDGWRERGVAREGDRLAPILLPEPIEHLPDAPTGSIAERNPAAATIITALAARLRFRGGALLAIDYGYAGPAFGDTVQAMRAHAPVDPLAYPGEADLTAHVDFTALADAARAGGLATHGPIPQGTFLRAMGIGLRTAALTAAAPARADEIAAARDRLISPDAMGALFKVAAYTAPGWPVPAGFAQ